MIGSGDGPPEVVLDLDGKHELARDLAAGGVFVPGAALSLNEECELVLRGADEVRVAALVVFVNAAGAGLQLVGCDAEMKQRIAALANPGAPEPAAEAEPEPEPESEDSSRRLDPKRPPFARTCTSGCAA